jgi:drug/metabolite transporter (DMT)-like permease
MLFAAMLLSSLYALSYVSAVTLIVMRNLSTICVAVFELMWLGTEVKFLTWLTLIGILVGSVLFGARDMTFRYAKCMVLLGSRRYDVLSCEKFYYVPALVLLMRLSCPVCWCPSYSDIANGWPRLFWLFS